MILVTTVWHTGTHSLVDWLNVEPQEIRWLHCCNEAVELAKSGNYKVVTTYRDPAETALSWAKRGNFPSDVWREQWTAYKDIYPLAEVIPVTELRQRLNRHPDKPGSDPPKEDIEFALDCIKTLPLRFSG